MIPKDDYAPIIPDSTKARDCPHASSLKRSEFSLKYVQVTLDLNS